MKERLDVLLVQRGLATSREKAKAMMKERLAEETELACSLVQTEEDFSGFARYSNNDAFRVTIIDLSGNVLFESDTKSPLENHIDREEVKNALCETDGTGRFKTIKFEDDSVVYSLTCEAITDEDAYNDAMNKYRYKQEHRYTKHSQLVLSESI